MKCAARLTPNLNRDSPDLYSSKCSHVCCKSYRLILAIEMNATHAFVWEKTIEFFKKLEGLVHHSGLLITEKKLTSTKWVECYFAGIQFSI